MRARISKNLGLSTVMILAFVVIVLYSLWGAMVLRAQHQASAPQQPLASR